MTPLDIQQQKFKTSLRGYDRAEVLDFLEIVRREYELLVRENRELRHAQADLKAEVAQLREREDELRRCISAAQGLADEVLQQARREAEVLQGEARLQADRLQAESEQRADKLQAESEQRAAKLLAEATQRAERLEHEAKQRAERLEVEARKSHDQTLHEAQAESSRLRAEVASLRRLREKLALGLRGVLESHLSLLDAHDASVDDSGSVRLTPRVEPAPPRAEPGPPWGTAHAPKGAVAPQGGTVERPTMRVTSLSGGGARPAPAAPQEEPPRTTALMHAARVALRQDQEVDGDEAQDLDDSPSQLPTPPSMVPPSELFEGAEAGERAEASEGTLEHLLADTLGYLTGEQPVPMQDGPPNEASIAPLSVREESEDEVPARGRRHPTASFQQLQQLLQKQKPG
jgi:DivIVA domain-containing protein